jgi:hypothetical protein
LIVSFADIAEMAPKCFVEYIADDPRVFVGDKKKLFEDITSEQLTKCNDPSELNILI